MPKQPPKKDSSRSTRKQRTQPRYDPARSQAPEMIELVDPRWILKALGGILALALVFAYATLCLVYNAKQWQLVLHPTHTFAQTPGSFGMAFQDVQFGVDDSGQPQLDGWFVPGAAPSARTVLLLHDGDGDMADAMSTLTTLHSLPVNVLLFDYRGFGKSGLTTNAHPSEARMFEDARHAYDYLVSTRGVAAADIIVYGKGVGGAVATALCSHDLHCRALVLEAPRGDLLAQAAADPRSKIVPTSLLFHERFSLSAPLRTLATPKLLITFADNAPAALSHAADPKMLVELDRHDEVHLREALLRFLDNYIPEHP
jgi:pimeloyl-ACP methyl ester carboxylesterase